MANKPVALAIGLMLSAGSALAADPMLPWTGFYAGINAGYTASESNTVKLAATQTFLVGPPLLGDQGRTTSSTFLAAANTALSPDASGFIGGGQAGYNLQLSNGLVTGFETDIQGSTASGSATRSVVIPLPVPLFDPGNVVLSTSSVSKSIDYVGTVRGRLGFLAAPALLAYATGGLAYGGVRSSASTTQFRNGPVVPFGAANSFSDTHVGWTVGAGGEWMFMPNWSAKAEYLYYDLGSATYNVGALNQVLLPPLPVPPGGTLGSASFQRATTRFDGNIFRVAINYHF
jgi:outer membrane immunogenic protein